ncbi:MAG: RluA family pseudouridine synthase [Christensenellales bacterium]
MVLFSVAKEHENMELYDVLTDTYPDFSDKSLRYAFKNGIITINDEDAYPDDIAHESDIVCIFAPGDVVGVDLTPKIIYQDENIFIMDKPAGLPSVSQTGGQSAVGIAEDYMKQNGEYSIEALMVPYLIYPLDTYVSGVLLVAKHEGAYMFFLEALGQRRISRYYICPVKGSAGEQEELLGYHKRDKAGRRAQISGDFKKDSKPVVTRYIKISQGDEMSLLRVRPVTNGLHQVRAHLSFCGIPILGDGVYGDKRFNSRFGAEYICMWLELLIFEVGSGHGYDYLNGKRFRSMSESFPISVFDQGLMDFPD